MGILCSLQNLSNVHVLSHHRVLHVSHIRCHFTNTNFMLNAVQGLIYKSAKLSIAVNFYTSPYRQSF